MYSSCTPRKPSARRSPPGCALHAFEPRLPLQRSPDQSAWRSFLKATVKATRADAHVQGSTIQQVGLALQIQNNPGWISTDVLGCDFLGLQNQWSASLAMSTDGSFPSRPRQFLNTIHQRERSRTLLASGMLVSA